METTKNIKGKKSATFLLTLLLMSACTLDYVNPNSPSDKEVLSSRDGLISLSTGLRQYYSTQGLDAILLSPGATAREVKGISTFTNILEIEAGGTGLPNFNGNVLNVWSRMFRVIESADEVIVNVPIVLNADDVIMSTGLIAHAKLFKAMALSALATSFEEAPVATQADGLATFVPRAELLATGITLLNEAAAALTTNPPAGEFNTRVAGADFYLVNCVNAMRARLNLMAGNYQAAIDAANLVNLAQKSEYKYSTLSVNPIWNTAVIGLNFKPRENFGLPVSLIEPADTRLTFYLANPTVVSGGENLKSFSAFFSGQTTSIPVYIPDEMKLIRAEAELRLNGAASIAQAVTDVNSVRTQSAGDPFNIYANLPEYAGPLTVDDVLLEIYKQRSAELFLSGVRLEDSRRFGRPDPSASLVERNRNFYPYPVQERTTNSNTPADPAI